MRRWAVIAALLLACASASFAGVIVKKEKRWTLPANRKVPVLINDFLPPFSGSGACDTVCRIRKAIAEWNAAAAGIIEFEEVPVGEMSKPFIRVRQATQSERDSHEGIAAYVPEKSRQILGPHDLIIVALPDRSFEQTIQHELGHLVGLGHEHQHRDRKKYIEFRGFLPVLKSWIYSNYNVVDEDEYDSTEPYDFRSVMHYVREVGWEPTEDGIKRLDEQRMLIARVGWISGLSNGDWHSLRILYCDLPQDCPLFTPAQNTIMDFPVSACFPKPPRTEMRR